MIKKRGNRWWVVVYAGRDPLTGRKRQKTGTAATKAEARQLEARLISQVGAGQHGGAAGKTVADLIEAWFQWRPLLYRAEVSADQAPATAEPIAEQTPTSAAVAPSSAAAPQDGAEVLTKRAQAERAYAELSATGAPVSAGQLAAAAGLSASYARALVAEFQTRPSAAVQGNGRART